MVHPSSSDRGVVVLSGNPALEHTWLVADRLTAGRTQALAARTEAGGKAAHVARTAATLGARVTLVGWIGAEPGDRYGALVAEEPFTARLVSTDGSTREFLTVVSRRHGHLHDVADTSTAPGPDAVDEMGDILRAALATTPPPILVVSGSAAGPAVDELYLHAVTHARDRGAPVLVDAMSDALPAMLAQGPLLATPNVEELGEISGRAPTGIDELADAAGTLRRMGAAAVLVTCGASGGMLVSDGRVRRVARPRVTDAPDDPQLLPAGVWNPVGSGDATLGAIAWRLAVGADLHDATLWGMAAGVDNATRWRCGHVDRQRVAALRAHAGQSRPARPTAPGVEPAGRTGTGSDAR